MAMCRIFSALWLCSLLSLGIASSFYENPDQDAHALHGPDVTSELHKKWDFEVSLLTM